jgi:hypothetical protein
MGAVEILLDLLCQSQFWRIEIWHLPQYKYSDLIVVQG